MAFRSCYTEDSGTTSRRGILAILLPSETENYALEDENPRTKNRSNSLKMRRLHNISTRPFLTSNIELRDETPKLYNLGVGEWLRKLSEFAGSWPREVVPYWVSTWGLDPTFAVKVGLLYLALYFAGLRPRITSGFRDPAKQAAMRAAWDRGERQGLRVRPADPKNSLHCRGTASRPASQAIDMPCDNDALGAQLAQGLGLRAGYFFSTPDPGHYDNGGL